MTTTTESHVHHCIQHHPAAWHVVALAAAMLLGFAAVPARAQLTILPNAQVIEWDCPLSGEEVGPGTADPNPGALVVDPLGRVWYATRFGIPRVIRVTFPSDLLNQPAICNWWEFEVGGTGGVRLVLANNWAFVRTLANLQRIDTVTNQRTIYADNLEGLSDLAVKGSNSNVRVYTTGTHLPTGNDVLQELNPSSGAVRRWTVGTVTLTGFEFLSGVAVHTFDSNLVYYSERFTDNVGEVNVNLNGGASLVSGTTANTIRRWNLAAIPSATPISGPRQISIDSFGNVWVVTFSGHIVKIDPATNEVAAYELPLGFLKDPFALDANGTIGYTASLQAVVGMLIPLADTTPFSPDVQLPVAPTPGNAALDTVPQPQRTGPAPPIVKSVTATQLDSTDSTVIEAAVLEAGHLEPLGIARDPAFEGTYFYAVGASDLRFARVALPSEEAGLVTGGGYIPLNGSTDKGSFGLVAMRRHTGGPVKGNIVYQNHATGARVKSGQITDMTFVGNKATFSGTCASGCTTFRVDVTDNGAPWNTPRDDFKIFKNPLFDILNLPVTPAEGGTLDGGNIKVTHR